jgi:2-oxoglutarate dehydrogenase E1 component
MLLPHGYEGQGPEHSSARLERFLQLSAEENWTIAYLSSAAQYFHLLRRQAASIGTAAARPLVVMAPKSLIRNPRVASPASSLSEGGFQTILEQAGTGEIPDRVTRLILCTGKMAVDLEESLDKENGSMDWLHIVRIEQLYPLPLKELKSVAARFPNVLEAVWVQEEPANMGAWRYMAPHIRGIVPESAVVRYIGRPERSSPASGYQRIHSDEQNDIVAKALRKDPITAHKQGGNGHA